MATRRIQEWACLIRVMTGGSGTVRLSSWESWMPPGLLNIDVNAASIREVIRR